MSEKYDLAGQVIGIAMKVHNALGAGFLESVYERAMAHELRKAQVPFQSQLPIMVRYDGAVVGEFVADLLVADELIVELKAVQELAVAHEVQTVNYLTATGKDHGLLLNFGGERLQFKKKFRVAKPKGSSQDEQDKHEQGES